jgi:predicted DNA-binding protein
MTQGSSLKDVRLNVVIPLELKERLRRIAAGKGKKISVLVRESIEDSVLQMERQIFEEKMRNAYLDMAQENLEITEDFKHSDAENLRVEGK